MKIDISDQYFFSETDQEVRLVNLNDSDDNVIILTGASGKLFLHLVNGEEEKVKSLKDELKLSDEKFQQFTDILIENLNKHNVLK